MNSGVAALLKPQSIAIVGASDKSRWSRTAFDNLTRSGFDGKVQLVNRRGGVVHGQHAAEKCAALDGGVDLGIVVVPAEAVPDAIDDLACAKTRAAVVLTSGFAETGVSGARLQDEVLSRARRHDIRLLGPNSLGYINFADNVQAWTTPVRAPSQRTGTAILSQSGATAFFLAELAYQQDLGVSYVIGTGNEADLEVSAFIDYFIDDPSTRSIALFVETLRNPTGFIASAQRALQAAKPIVVLKVGASEATARSAAAHTGALVGDDRVFDGLCRQFGIIRARSIEELLAIASVAARTGVLRDGGLAIVSNSGGICEIAADTAERAGIGVPALGDATVATLRDSMPGFGTPHNPLDLTGGIEPAQCETALRKLGEEPGIAALLAIWYAIPTCREEESERLTALHRHLSRALNEAPIPGLLSSYTHAFVNDHARGIIADTGAPYFAFGLDRAIAALAGVQRWSQAQRRQHQRRAGAALPQASISAFAPTGEQPVSERAALAFLARHGVPVVPATLATDEAAAVAAAQAIGGPVVLKIASDDIAHKSDIGGVALNLDGGHAVAAAWRRIMASVRADAPTARLDGILVSPMRERGTELIVGLSRDPQWGLVLAVGLGGVWVEIMKDVSLRVLPVDVDEIRIMLSELRGAALLAGQRGIPPANLDNVAAAIAAIAQAAVALGPALAEMDVNPLWVRGDAVEALDALFVFRS